jgi:hypothetical protein
MLINIWPTYNLPVRTEAGRKSITRRTVFEGFNTLGVEILPKFSFKIKS